MTGFDLTTESTALLEAVVGAIESGDPGVVVPMLAPGAVVWHNDDGIEMPASDAFAGLSHLHQLVEGLRIDVLRHDATGDGLVARIEFRGTVRSTGTNLRARNCFFLTASDGRICRIDEYVDPTFRTQLGL